MVEVVVVGFDQLGQVFRGESLLKRAGCFLNPLHAGLERPLQVNHQVRFRHRFRKKAVELVVDQKLRVVQVQTGKDLVLGEVIVGKHQRGEKIDLGDLPLLLITREKEKELCLERRTDLLLVEVGEKRVVDV